MRQKCTAAAAWIALSCIIGGARAQAGDSSKDNTPKDNGPKDDAPKLGQKIAKVTFATADGTVALDDLKDKEAVVAAFFSFQCPNCTGFAPILAHLAKKYAERKVAFVGICCGEDDTPSTVA